MSRAVKAKSLTSLRDTATSRTFMSAQSLVADKDSLVLVPLQYSDTFKQKCIFFYTLFDAVMKVHLLMIVLMKWKAHFHRASTPLKLGQRFFMRKF